MNTPNSILPIVKIGLIAMAHHCFDDTINEPRITPQPYLHLTHALFNLIPEEIEQKSKKIGGVIRAAKSIAKTKKAFPILGTQTHSEK